MKVILTKDVVKVGQKFSVVNVSDGYALNFLFPRGLARLADDKALKEVEKNIEKAKAEQEMRDQLLTKNVGEISKTEIKISEKANEKGHLFAGIHKEEIAKAIKESAKLDIPVDSILLDEAIKEVGETKVKIKVGDKEAEITVLVEALEE